jgi:tetratricopeptide (TPR) repeat protein
MKKGFKMQTVAHFSLKKAALWVSVAVMAFSQAAFANSRLNELKKRKVELDQLQEKCAALSGGDQADCMAKRQKKVDAYKRDLSKYKDEVAKERSKNPPTELKDDPASTQTRIDSRNSSIKEFTDYVNSCNEKTERCASALFQVANLTYQNEEDAFLIKQGAYEKQFATWEDRDRKGPEPVQPRRDHKISLGYFEKFLKEYPNHRDVPPALVRAAFIADMQGNEDRSYEYLNLLVTRFPDHPLGVQSHLRLGEYWLLKRKYAKAIEHYEKVPLNYPGNEAGLALYHRAEAFYNMANFEEAARWYFEYVSRADAGKLKADLRDEAMAFMAASWADLDNGFEVAESFLRSKGNPPWEKDIYYEIGVKNQGHDRLDEAVKSFKFLLEKDPTYAKAPIADLNIIEILVLQKKADEAQEARMALVKRYEEGSAWHRKNSGNQDAVQNAQKAVRIAMYTIPVYYHTKGDEGKGDPDMLRKAEAGYREYLQRYNEQSWEVYQVHQHLAVLYNKLKEYKRSASEWDWCGSANTDKFGKLASDRKDIISKQDAAYNAVIMMDENRKAALESKYNKDKAAAYQGSETREYFSYVEKYMAKYGTSNSAPELAYNAGFVDYEAKQYKAAISSLTKLVERFPNHKYSIQIRRALAQSLLEDGQFEVAEKQFTVLSSQVCKGPKADPKMCDEVKRAMATTVFKQAESKSKSGDHATAAQKYLQLARDFRDVDIADKALFEAGVNFDSAGRTDEGVRTLLRIPQEHPKSDLRIKAVLKAASLYMNKKRFREAGETFLVVQKSFPTDSMGFISIGWAADAYEKAPDLRKAAQTYESAYRLYPDHLKTPGFLYNAGQLYEQAKEWGDAISVYKLLGDKYPKSTYAIEAVFSVPLILERKGDYAKAAAAYEDFAKQYENDKGKLIRAHLGAGKNYKNLGNEKKALEHFSKCIAVQKKAGEAEREVMPPAIPAEAAYLAGEIFYDKMKKTRLDGTKGQNQNRVSDMQQNLVQSIQFYAKGVEMAEEEWALRSTMRMGDLFFTIATISDNERPVGLSSDDRLRSRIESKATIPEYLQKATELYKKNLDIALNQGIDNPLVDTTGMRMMEAYLFKGQSMEELSRLLPQAPLPKTAGQEERDQLKQAADETLLKAGETYKEALNIAQTYSLNNEARTKIVERLREVDSAATEVNFEVPAKQARPVESGAAVAEGGAPEGSTDIRDSKYESNMKRISKIYGNSALTDDQKVELLMQMEAEARREIGDLEQEMASQVEK